MLRLVAVAWAVPIDLPPIDLVSKPRVADAATLIPAGRERREGREWRSGAGLWAL